MNDEKSEIKEAFQAWLKNQESVSDKSLAFRAFADGYVMARLATYASAIEVLSNELSKEVNRK